MSAGSKFQKFLRYINKYIEEISLVILLSSMSIIIVFQVFMRYVMKNSLSWSEEVARYIFIWIIYLGISYGIKMKRHIKMDAGLLLFPVKSRKYILLLSDIISLIFSIIILFYGYEVTSLIVRLGQASPAMGISMGYLYAAPVVGFSLVSVRLLQNIAGNIRSIRSLDKD